MPEKRNDEEKIKEFNEAIQETEQQTADPTRNGLTSSIYTSVRAPFDEKEYFKSYHFYERFNSAKQYIHEQMVDYGHGLHRYKHSKYTINVCDKNQDHSEVYVVAVEQLTEAEKEELAPWCPCSACNLPWILLGVLFICFMTGMCPHCWGCLAATPTSFTQWVIDGARERRKTHPPRAMSLATWKQILGMFVGLTLMLFLCAIAMLLGCFMFMGVGWGIITSIGFIRMGIEQILIYF